jgi:Peptidase family M1 domain/Peptidase M1 N-terminal domain
MFDTALRRSSGCRRFVAASVSFAFTFGAHLAFGAGLALAQAPTFTPGAAGAGDPYFPLDGNGGYDVEHYSLDLRYDPDTDVLDGVASIDARATQDLSSFHLDLVGLEVGAISVDDAAASWERDGGELIITPAAGLQADAPFRVVIEYGGVPETLSSNPGVRISGFMHTPDGAVIAGEPHVAATWFPANDHPRDRAAFTFKITVPEGLEAVANGVLESELTEAGSTTWVWNAESPMAPYLAGLVIGDLLISAYEVDGIRYWDAFAARLIEPTTFVSPTTGLQLLQSTPAEASYQRLSRVIAVPAEGADLSFSVALATAGPHDSFFVEAHAVGRDDWTTLPDVRGLATRDTGGACAAWLALHPFLRHYQAAADEAGPCVPSGATGEWWAVSGLRQSERWTVDLSAWAGTDVEVALSHVTEEAEQSLGVFVDDLVVSTGEGSTSFEDDGDTLDGWSMSGVPEASSSPDNPWAIGPAFVLPPIVTELPPRQFARQPEVIAFLEENFGPYPFDTAGAIVPFTFLSFALESQTRPIYPLTIFGFQGAGVSVIVHELAHQWFGDSLALDGWQHIWLNEGFATYAQWLWDEHEGLATAQQAFDTVYAVPADNSLWNLSIGDPGPDRLFDGAVYARGAMTLHRLRQVVGDEAFFSILQEWARCRAGQTVTTDDFIAFAETLSGQDLGALFQAWLFVPAKPLI